MASDVRAWMLHPRDCLAGTARGAGREKRARPRERWSRRVARAETDAHLVRDGHDARMPVRGRAEFTVMMKATTRDEALMSHQNLRMARRNLQAEKSGIETRPRRVVAGR